MVNTGKTQFVPLGADDNHAVLEWLAAIPGGWHHARVGGCMKYLGATVGPTAHETYWDATTAKFLAAGRTLAALQLPTFTATWWYKVAVQAIPAYLCSLSAPNAAIEFAEATTMARITNTPNQSIPSSSWQSLQLIGIPFIWNSLHHISLAARFRLHYHTTLMPDILDDINAVLTSDDAFVHPRVSRWLACSLVQQCADAHSELIGSGLLDSSVPERGVQAAVLKHLRTLPAVRGAASTVEARLQSLVVVCPIACIVDSTPARAAAFKKLPSFLWAASFKAAHNAWVTSRRFGREVRPCPWCLVRGGDDLMHLLRCSRMLEILEHWHPELYSAWCLQPHPPLIAVLLPAAFGFGAGETDTTDAIIWMDFLAFIYHCPPHSDREWLAAWKSRARVYTRYAAEGRMALRRFKPGLLWS